MSLKHPCFVCRGACCESIVIDFGAALSDYGKEYFAIRCEVERLENNHVGYRIRNRCPKLLNGLCSIHETKPQHCKEGKIGAMFCLNAIMKYRSKKEQNKIIEAIDEFNA